MSPVSSRHLAGFEISRFYLCVLVVSLSFLLVLLLGVLTEAPAQTINGSDSKYNTPIAAMNHLILGLDLVKAGTPDDLYYARQNFVFIINMKDDRGLRPIAYLNLGVVDTLEDKPEAAIKNFLSAIQLNANYSEAYFNLGAVYYKIGSNKKAEESFLKAIELDPNYGRAHYSLGFLYFEQKKYDLAKLHAEKAAENGVPYKTLKERLARVGR